MTFLKISLILFLSGGVRSMANTIDSSILRLSYTEFLTLKSGLKIDSFKKATEILVIENPNNIFHSNWSTGEELPLGGLFFEDIESITSFINLKELRLIDLFVNELPEDFTKLEKLEKLELCFSYSGKVKSIIKILLKMKSLKYLDINGSRLSEKQRSGLSKELSKKGIHIDDRLMLKST